MRWNEPPRRALVLLKPDQELLPIAAETIAFLQQGMDLTVMVEVAAAEAVGEVKSEKARSEPLAHLRPPPFKYLESICPFSTEIATPKLAFTRASR